MLANFYQISTLILSTTTHLCKLTKKSTGGRKFMHIV